MTDFQDFVNFSILSTDTIKIKVITIIGFILTTFVTIFLLRILKRALSQFEKKRTLDEGSVTSIYLMLKYLLWTIAIAFMLDLAGVKVTLLLASSAALLVGLGFGIQHIFNDLVSGILILIEHNIKVGDIIEIENEKVGMIVKIGLRTSKLQTRDDIIIVMPNNKLVSENTINWSHIDWKTRFNIKIGVAYGSDTRKVESVLLACTKTVMKISEDPKPFVRFLDFGESSLDFQLFFWTDEVFRVENIKSELRFLIEAEFRKENIQIPFPQRDVHIITDKN